MAQVVSEVGAQSECSTEGRVRINEYAKNFLVCEPEHSPLLFQSNEDTEEKSTKDLLNHMKDSEKQEDLMAEASSETARSYVFKIDNLCMFAGEIYNDG